MSVFLKSRKTMQLQLLNELEVLGFSKAAFHAKDYVKFELPEIANEALSLPADSWNSGSNRRILIPAGASIRLITQQDCYALGAYGTDCDKLMGLWCSNFSYTWG